MKKKILAIIKLLKDEFPYAHCELMHEGPFQLLVATILSAQTSDVQVNKVTPRLFQEFPDSSSLAKAPLEKIEELIKSIGLYRNKAKNLKSMSQIISSSFEGVVPETMEELILLPGVGRKTANVILGNAFNKSYGIVVDTHVQRISTRLELTKSSTPEKIEKELMAIVPQEEWTLISHLFIFLGRRVCKSRSPQCASCCLNHLCPSANKI